MSNFFKKKNIYLKKNNKNDILFYKHLNLLIENRKYFNHKICYKKRYNFLKFKSTPTKSLATRLFNHGNFLKTYKLCKKYFYKYFLFNNIKKLDREDEFFKFFYNSVNSRDFDQVLLWKIQQIDCIFDMKLNKKDPKYSYIYYIKDQKRYLLVLSWLKCLFFLEKKKYNSLSLFKPLDNFLLSKKTDNQIYNIKLIQYHLKLIQFFRDL